MPKKEGICKNIECEKFNESVEVEPGEEFVCPKCGKPLREKSGGKNGRQAKGKGGKGKMIGIIAVAAIVLAGICYFVFMPADKSTEIVQEDPIIEEPKDNVGQEAENVSEEDNSVTDGPIEVIEQPKPSVYGTVDLGYASYTGDLKDGKPHGHGTLTYKAEHRIVSSKDFIAQPGDTFDGEFRNGRISGQGYWKHDGNTVLVKP